MHFELWTRTINSRVFGALSALVAALLICATAASAQVIIIKSTVKSLKAGTLLDAKTEVSIPKGGSAVVVLPSGAMRTIAGPFKGPAANLTKGVKANPDLWKEVKRYVVTGGTNQKRVGALRSAMPTSYRRSPPFSWNKLPIRSGGDFCVEKDAKISLVRRFIGRSEVVTIINMQSKHRIKVVFDKGVSSIPWPEDLAIDPRITYTFVIANAPPREVRLRVIEPLPPHEDTLQVLHGQRCQNQFRAFLRELRTASR